MTVCHVYIYAIVSWMRTLAIEALRGDGLAGCERER